MEECCRLKPVNLLKITLLHRCLSHFLNCTNGTKLRKASCIFKQFGGSLEVSRSLALVPVFWEDFHPNLIR